MLHLSIEPSEPSGVAERALPKRADAHAAPLAAQARLIRCASRFAIRGALPKGGCMTATQRPGRAA